LRLWLTGSRSRRCAATASGRTYLQELIRTRDGHSEQNYALYHDRYQRTDDGWKFTERVYEVRYRDTTPLAGSAP
jgi:SnoaL-like domain